jgi:hypothetical protein
MRNSKLLQQVKGALRHDKYKGTWIKWLVDPGNSEVFAHTKIIATLRSVNLHPDKCRQLAVRTDIRNCSDIVVSTSSKLTPVSCASWIFFIAGTVTIQHGKDSIRTSQGHVLNS